MSFSVITYKWTIIARATKILNVTSTATLNMNIPLTFLTDDILKTMATSRKNYFVLNKEKSRDNRDHFFIFEVSTVDENPLIYHYTYKKTTIYLAEK